MGGRAGRQTGGHAGAECTHQHSNAKSAEMCLQRILVLPMMEFEVPPGVSQAGGSGAGLLLRLPQLCMPLISDSNGLAQMCSGPGVLLANLVKHI